MAKPMPREQVMSLRKVFVGFVVFVGLAALLSLIMFGLSPLERWTNSRSAKRVLNFHGRVVNAEDKLQVVLFGHDGPDDDVNKYVSEVQPNEAVEPREEFHVDFVVSANCTVWKFRGPFGWRWRWSWKRFEKKLGRDGEKWIREMGRPWVKLHSLRAARGRTDAECL